MSKKEQGAPQGGYLTIDQIRAAKDLEPFDVEVPEWGGRVQVRPFSMEERASVRKVGEGPPRKNPDGTWGTEFDAEEIELETVIQGCVAPRFSRGDKDWLRAEKSSGAVSKISSAILEASGMGPDAVGKRSGASGPTPS